ncbi:EscU/YscU/HrcU family type III secretion system export apparatus switch protein [Domibacillus sp. PGB-M46]|uniref:EscU/YscU/HrcU family type III secretion system export apparatus switch protein n=1 Tax=Domibacillus sp. PGB-M46 TaxID=2910255 RepID=UPI001F59C2DD|nr:EscU/YscU/HrcU family type III secretion system export apparatus switch protein [Domibacillus sp. PGB-M46]MCI2253131.1 EscU/YscU/HrcU family type III secretion system export apparatus switch protein [Domibacillus sp. PGB-M46]
MNQPNRRQAAALSYNPDSVGAPVIKAKGKGLIADQIIASAKENNIPIQEDPGLVELLGQLEINEAIPEDLYQAVAEVFAFIYRLDQSLGK